MIEGMETAELVCEAFTKWGLKKYTCDIKYYTEEPLDDFYFVICSILNLAEGRRQSKCGLGILLGFALKDQKDEEGRKIYYDKAEEKLFEDILRLVEKERLIRVEGDVVSLTELGRISLKEKKHYKFFSGTQEVYEHSAINSNTPMSLLMFPFYADMGISTSVKTYKAIWPEDHGIEKIIYYENDQLKKRLEQQSEEKSNIYFAEEQKYFEIEVKKVPVRLYKRGSDYVPVVLNGDRIAQKATELINNGLNHCKQENIILECLFQKLWDDDSAALDYKSLEPYFDIVDYQELVKDSRMVWQDERLFDKIAEKASASCWGRITANCNIDVLCKKLDSLSEFVDWPTLTERVGDYFLLNNFLTYPWDLEVISNDENRGLPIIERLLLKSKDSNEEWDWEALGERLPKDFVIGHLDVVDVDLAKYTEDSETIRNAIVSYSNRRWDWNKIEETFNLQYILYNIEKLCHHLKFEPLFDRIFTSPFWATEFIESKKFRDAVENATRQGGSLHSTTLNRKNYIWTNGMIDFLSSVGLILWKTTPYIAGFESNPHLVWSKGFFNRYSKNVTTDEGRRLVSGQIRDVDIIIDANDFIWDWDAVSSNTALLSDKRLFYRFGDKLIWNTVFKNQKDAPFFESIDKIDSMIGNDADAWSSFSQIADLEYVKKTWRNPHWDWQILTKRLFIGEGGISLNLNALGHKDFVCLWNWTYLSENVGIDFLKRNLDNYCQYWDWNKVMPRIVPEERKFDTCLLRQYALTLAKVEDSTKSKNAWTALTAQYSSIEDIKHIIKETGNDNSIFRWDIEQVCKTKGFNIFRDLALFRDCADWDALSCSNAVDKCLIYNKRLGIKKNAWEEDVREIVRNYKKRWNFYSLTRFESLKDERWFLSDYKDKIDWNYISQYSKVFREKDKQALNSIIGEYKSYIDFITLSKRDDVDINEIIRIHPEADYDYNSLIERGEIWVTEWLIKSTPKYAWDWHLLTSSADFQPSPDFLLTHINENINWEALSSSQDTAIWESEKLIKAVAKDSSISQQINWFAISTIDNFPVSFSTFCVIPFEKLNWDRLSRRKEIIAILDCCKEWINWRALSNSGNYGLRDINFLSRYADYLDWGVVCNKTGFKFTNEILEKFPDYIDWTAASGSEDIEFSEQLVRKYIYRWNWAVLKTNKAFHNTVDVTSLPYKKLRNIVQFVSHFNGINSEFCFDGRPKAYHFTHMDNAVKIIRSMKLQSRNLANGSFSNSARSVVDRTDKAHKYARFYFAPKSPTQFYNEFLGKDKDNSRYYERAKNQMFPKCPLPVFFIFDIGEILSVFPDSCYYSNGNMQKNGAKVYRVTENPDNIKSDEIFTIPYGSNKEEKQQEFLVEGELDFSKLRNVQICCYNEYQADMLRKELRKEQNGSQWADIISCNPDLYVQKNKQLTFEEEINYIKIFSDYKEPYELKISYTGGFGPTIINRDNIKSQKGNDIYMDSSVYLKKDAPFEVYFEVRKPRFGSWLIYKNE